MFRTKGGVARAGNQTNLKIPEYPIPKDLESVLNVKEESELSRTSEMYSKVLIALHAAKSVDLAECHYFQLLKLALFLEEYQSNQEMTAKKLINQKIEKLAVKDSREILFSIRVEALDEERAWIREGDFVDVTDTTTFNLYSLRVSKVIQEYIVASDESAKLASVFVPSKLYNISFRFQNYPLKCAHKALWLCFMENVITYFFPLKSKPFINTDNKSYGGLTMLNPCMETNPEQKQAVLNIVNKSAHPAPYILYGPPGTGKTATLVEAISQIHKASSSNRVLVCTPSNTAADEVAKRLLKYVEPSAVYRIYTQSRDKSSVDKELRNCSFYGGEKNKLPLRRDDIAGKSILITTLCTAMRLAQMELSPDYFSHICIDEAGQGHEADILIPICIASKNGKLHSQIVLAGDPQQLGPTIISKLAEIILGRSILERLMSYDTYKKDCYNKYNPKYITKLLQNYRSRSSIIHISNKLFYDNELVAKYSSDEHKVDFPVIFHGVDGVEEQYSYSPSTYNYEEIKTVLKYVYHLIDNRTQFGEVSAKDIGICTPFKLQSKRIKKILAKKDGEERRLKSLMEKYMKVSRKGGDSDTDSEDSDEEKDVLESENEKDEHEIGTTEADKIKLRMQSGNDVELNSYGNQIKYRNLKKIKVSTTELFQGQERKIMIITAVRSKTFVCSGKESIGYFVARPNRFNVMMSRAQNALIVIGNPGILQKDDMWHYLISYCMANKSYRGIQFALQPPSNKRSYLTDLQNIPSTTSLFKEQPFKLFQLDPCDMAFDEMFKTVDLFVGPGRNSDMNLLAADDLFIKQFLSTRI